MIHALSPVGDSLRMAGEMFWETLWALVLGFALSGAVQAFVSRSEMQRLLGGNRSGDIARATFFGAASSSCSYAAAAMAKTLFQRGADFTSAMVFMFASTNLVVELGIVLWILVGWQFTAAEFIGGLLMILVFTVLARVLFPRRITAAARRRLTEHAATADQLGEAARQRPWRERVRSWAGWSDAAGYTLADVGMLRREMLIGYLVAGLLAVLVPTSVWNGVFLTGHGFWTSLENVLVGPLIALVSFVCSIGNVPLAAALWQGGISFGGVISFIFADLIALPLLLIYRKYYGTALALRLLAAFWLVMSSAGLIVEYVARGADLVPSTRPSQIVQTSVGANYTTALNLVALAGLVAIAWLARHQEHLGGGHGYALDPVCGMQVQRAAAPTSAHHHDRTYYFCAERCRDRFLSDPDRYTARADGDPTTQAPASPQGGSA